MKFKLLVNGNNLTVLKEFFGYTEEYFSCVSTTDIMGDLIAHFEMFKPDVFLSFLDDNNYESTVEQLRKLKTLNCYNGAPIIFVVKEGVAEQMEEEVYNKFASLVIKRPITSDNIVLRIINFIEEQEKKKALALRDAAALEKERAKAEEAAKSGAKKHILVCDDDRNTLKLLKNAIEEKYEVTAVLNGLLVEKVLASKPIDLIILDYEMPIMTGAEVYKNIKANENYSDIPVCFLTGVSERSKVAEIMTLKPNGYLLKPIEMDMLMSAIDNLIK